MKYLVVLVLFAAAALAVEEPKRVEKRGIIGGYGLGLPYSVGLGGLPLGYGGLGYSSLAAAPIAPIGLGLGSPLIGGYGLPLAYSKTIAPLGLGLGYSGLGYSGLGLGYPAIL